MLTHDQVWRGIDRLAHRNEYSASGLAKKAGLDPTTFNKSKRITKEGKLRWPSTESLAKILEATSTNMSDFVRLIEGHEISGQNVPTPRLLFIRMSDLESAAATDESGYPVGSAWEEIDFPLVEDNKGFVVEIDQDSDIPAYRSGDMIVVSPTSGIRRNDRVLIRRRNSELVIGTMDRRTAHKVTVRSFMDRCERIEMSVSEIAWMARIVWISQ